MRDFPSYVDAHRLFGRHGFRGLDWHARRLLAGVNVHGRHALEVGGGEGILSLWMLWAGARSVTCLEPEADGATRGALARARHHRDRLGISDEVLHLRAERFQDVRPDRKYGLLLLRNSVNHLDEPATERMLEDPAAVSTYLDLFRRAYEMLEPGGALVLADCARINVWARLGRTNPFAPEIEWQKHQEPETWASVIARVGFVPAAPRWWHPTYRARMFAPLFDNRLGARLLASYFVLRAHRA